MGWRWSRSSATCRSRCEPGEIVGLAGLVGSGRSEILETIFGARRATAGEVSVDGAKLRNGSLVGAVKAGIGLAPEERKSQGLLLDEAVYRNITVSTMSRFSRAGFVDRAAERKVAREYVESLDVRPPGIERPVRTLSGGNQQKVVLARWLLRECRVLLLDEPTRGVDVGARTRDLRARSQARAEGVAVVVVSSEVEEVLGSGRSGAGDPRRRRGPRRTERRDRRARVLDLVMEGSVA